MNFIDFFKCEARRKCFELLSRHTRQWSFSLQVPFVDPIVSQNFEIATRKPYFMPAQGPGWRVNCKVLLRVT